MMKITVSDSTASKSFTLADEEVKALETDMVSVYDWIENAIKNKCRRVVNRTILHNTDKQPNKLSSEEKLNIIKDLSLETAKQRNKRIEEEIV